jgi:hypothetical protein
MKYISGYWWALCFCIASFIGTIILTIDERKEKKK